MRVSSPIGELPFKPQHVAIKGAGIEITGVMGAWPAHVQIDASDAPALMRVIARPVGIAAAITAVVFGLGRLARSRP